MRRAGVDPNPKGFDMIEIRSRFLRALLVAVGLNCAVIAGALAQTEYSEEKLTAFVAATVAMQAMARRWVPVIEGASSRSIADTYRAQANADMIGAIRNTEGITYDEYNEIVEAVRADTTLEKQVQDIYMARIPHAQRRKCMAGAEHGNTVKVHYTGTLADGSVFDTSQERGPLQVVVGSGSLIPGFEQALLGMVQGDNKVVTIAAEDAYGAPQDELIYKVERSEIPNEISVEVGAILMATDSDGSDVRLTVRAVDDASVTLDANHPLAGLELTFAIEMVEIS
jgi:peptidylprolyl isomerase